jgi:RNA recognition motif-containing protein
VLATADRGLKNLTEERRINIYVGNLAFEATEEAMETAFAEYGEVSSARVVVDRFSGRSRGFGFVEMKDDTDAETAIQALNGKEFQGGELTVNQARPR